MNEEEEEIRACIYVLIDWNTKAIVSAIADVLEAGEMIEEKKTIRIEFKVGKDETLRCDSCFKYLHDQKVHLYLNADGTTNNEVKCDTCWKEEQKEEKKWK